MYAAALAWLVTDKTDLSLNKGKGDYLWDLQQRLEEECANLL